MTDYPALILSYYIFIERFRPKQNKWSYRKKHAKCLECGHLKTALSFSWQHTNDEIQLKTSRNSVLMIEYSGNV